MSQRLLRLPQIIGDKKTGQVGLFPISKSMWYQGIADGRFPPPTKLGPRVSVWPEDKILELISTF